MKVIFRHWSGGTDIDKVRKKYIYPCDTNYQSKDGLKIQIRTNQEMYLRLPSKIEINLKKK